MNLSAPKQIVFIVSLILVIIGVLVSMAIIPSLPLSSFWIVVIGYAVLAFGCLFRGA